MDHVHNEHFHEPATPPKRRPLALALAITVVFLVVELVGGLLTNSLALLADAGHMATDAAALALALVAVWLARRPATPARSFGFYRAEVLAALANAATLIVICFFIFWEAIQRLIEPPAVDTLPMLVIAVLGLVANAGSVLVLMRSGIHAHDLNVRGAFLHVIGDLLGSVGTIAAAVVMLATGWYLADPILSMGIGLLILRSAWRLLWDSVDVLLEATPAHIDPAEVRRAMQQVRGVEGVHDLHIWTVTSGLVALSGHVEVNDRRDWHEMLIELATLLRERFGIAHVTLQPEQHRRLPEPFRGCSLDSPEGQSACLVPIPSELNRNGARVESGVTRS
ncbi:Cadmium, cobalt and zinc/H(+)-K(+) antiporter [bacterium HR26]|nr:Cadmium, cobalt and zinc/H(+)-K(+) antiporter [bacterium HR26]